MPAVSAPYRYELLERIATGGMAEVFRARSVGEHGFEKMLAIKRILPSLAADEEFVARFIAEAKLAVALTHTNIVQVMDLGRFGGSLYIAMEYVDGGDLAKLLAASHAAGRRVPPSVALSIAIELAKGLDYAHRRSARPVIHRDVSPSNILLSFAGEVKIADFGIAQAIEHASRSSDRRIMGKWRYMSPEQALGRPLDERTDIFSAAAVMYEMFTGRRLVPGNDPETIVRNLQEMTWTPLSSVRPDLPRELDQVVGRALRHDPGERYAHIEELMTELTEISYARSVRTSSLELAELVRQLIPAPRPAQSRRRAQLLDEIIRSEIGAPGSGGTRQTMPASVPAPVTAATAATAGLRTALIRGPALPSVRPRGAPGASPVRVPSFERGEKDQRGITEWRLVADGAVTSLRPRRELRRLFWGLGVAALVGALAWMARGRETPRPPAPAPQPAVLEVESTPPGAEVLIDGRPTRHHTPTGEALQLQAGEYRVGVRHAGFLFQETVQRLGPGESVRVPFTLQREPTVLAIGGEPPQAGVRVDGVQRGLTPLEILDLGPGPHEIRVEKRGYEPWQQTVELLPGGRRDLVVSLRESARFGRVDLNTIGSWANVYVDGSRRPFCKTPCSDMLLPAGARRLRFENPLLGTSVRRVVNVPADRKVQVLDVLLPRRKG